MLSRRIAEQHVNRRDAMKAWRFVVMCAFVILLAGRGYAFAELFKDVKVSLNKSATDRQLVEQDADLILDDQARKLVVKNRDHPLEVGYEDVQKVVFDTSTHMRGGKLGRAIGGLAGAAISAKHVTDSWCYLEYRGPQGTVSASMLILPSESSAAIVEKMRGLFGDKAIVADFAEKAGDIEKETLQDLKSKHDLKIDKNNHPTPEMNPAKALVVVVCPKIPSSESSQIKLHVNDRVVLVNRTGTYGFVYLDPGDYVLASQAENASAIHITLEAGKEYDFLQETFMGKMKAHTTLSRHTKELVMHQLNASFHADWTRK
jgi:hypothetical protein